MSVREKSAAALCLAIITFSILYPRSSFFRQRSYNLDEGTTAVCARVLLDGRMLYKDVVDSRPPLTHLAYALIFKRFGLFDLRSVHIALAALVAVLALLVYALGARIGGWRAGSAAALLFAAASFNYNSWDVLAFHTEWLMILFTAAAALCFLRGLSDGRRAWFVSAGASYALAVFSKQPAFLDFAAGVLFLCAAALAKPERWRERVRSLSALFYGFAAVSVLFAGILAAGGAWKDFWFYFWTYNVRYHVGLVPASDRILAFVRNLNDDGTYLHDNAALTFMTAAFLVWRRRWERTLGEDRGEAVGFVALWAVLAYAGSSLSGRGPGWGHYFFQVLPPFCVAAGLLVEAGIRELRSRLRVRALYSFPAVFLT
ncbi:MAG TPA: glycosyltransferase family 39 protein, partial [Candidatus Eisenbacteria bacterium]|nr:glycosyltransferase family 39 protein [Candidatus Eisenbacteria bacterium]